MSLKKIFQALLILSSFLTGSVFAAPSSSEPTSAYLFVHFIGESAQGEQIYFSVSKDGFHWEDLNDSTPVLISTLGEKGVRDPSIIRSHDGETFYILATDLRIASGKGWDDARFGKKNSLVIWESSDLINWSKPWLTDVAGAIPESGCAWAPEAIYDDSTGDYFVYWTTISPREGLMAARIFGAHTKDFRSFTTPELYIERPGKALGKGDIIDTQIIEVKEMKHRFYRVSRDGQITLEGGDTLTGAAWERIGDISNLGYTARQVEGPILCQFNQEQKWGLFVDQYGSDGGYLPLVSTNLDDPRGFHVPPRDAYDFGVSKKRHGSILKITGSEFDALCAKWPSHPFVSISPLGQPEQSLPLAVHAANPIITEMFTADPAPLVVGDTVYLYAGQDEAPNDRHPHYVLNRWVCFSTKDMKNWKFEGSPLKPTDFAWSDGAAWASQVVERNGKFYFYTSQQHAALRSKAIGVAVSDSPTGPFVDARGSALIENDMTTATRIRYDDIDPTVWIEDNGQAWLFWGNQKCYYAKLKDNMIELDGEIHVIPDDQVPHYTEAPWIHKRGNTYYLSYATGFPEMTSYSSATSLSGPWTPRGLLAEGAFNSNTIHQGIITFKGVDYFFYHTGGMQHNSKLGPGSSHRRSVCVDKLFYNPDGTLRRVVQTSEGVAGLE